MHDFIAIGDIVTDAFIKLKEAEINHDTDKNRDTITMIFGDKIPYEFVIYETGKFNKPVLIVNEGELRTWIKDVRDVMGLEWLKNLVEED